MEVLRVFVADDSPLDRRLIERLLEREASIELAGLSVDGAEAVAAAVRGEFDALVLDLEMPGLSGMETLRRLKKVSPGLRVIVFTGSKEASTIAQAEAAYGSAVQVLPKNEGGAGEIEMIGKRLIPMLMAKPWPKPRSTKGAVPHEGASGSPVAGAPTRLDPRQVLAPAVAPQPQKPRPAGRTAAPPTKDSSAPPEPRPARAAYPEFSILVIGASTGGPNALAKVLSELPEDLAVPILVTQHMPEGFTAAFAERLNRVSRLEVVEAKGGELLVPGIVCVAPGGWHLEVSTDGPRLATKLTDSEPENSCRPAVDPLFRSAASAIGSRTLAVVLTGMGRDGLAGARLVRQSGGMVVIQDEQSSVVWGMPGAVAQAGEADHIRPLDEISSTIVSMVGTGRMRRKGA